MSYGPPPEPEPPRVYDLSDTRTDAQRDAEERKAAAAKTAAAQASPTLLGSPFLSFSLFLTLVAYFIDGGTWMASAESFFKGKGRTAAAKPFIKWARHHPLSYGEVAITIDAVIGKPVIWDIVRSPADKYYKDSDGAKPVSWVEPVDALESALDDGQTAEVLARVDGQEEETILLMFIKLMQP